MPSGLAERLASAYYRYGPGRLPGADRRDVGGGYAFATVMAAFSAVFLLNQAVGVGWGDPWPSVLETPVHYATMLALLVGCGFVAGVLTWRYLAEQLTYFPRWSGLVASTLTHLFVVLVFDVIVVVGVGYLTWSERFVEIFVAYGIILVGLTRELWIAAVALYLFGSAGGYLYEQLRRTGGSTGR